MAEEPKKSGLVTGLFGPSELSGWYQIPVSEATLTCLKLLVCQCDAAERRYRVPQPFESQQQIGDSTAPLLLIVVSPNPILSL